MHILHLSMNIFYSKYPSEYCCNVVWELTSLETIRTNTPIDSILCAILIHMYRNALSILNSVLISRFFHAFLSFFVDFHLKSTTERTCLFELRSTTRHLFRLVQITQFDNDWHVLPYPELCSKGICLTLSEIVRFKLFTQRLVCK